jgi:TolB-like protein
MSASVRLAGLVLAFQLAGCATIISGTNQTIKVASNPSGAAIFMDGVQVGKTPVNLYVTRASMHKLILKMDGYDDFHQPLDGSLGGAFLYADAPLVLVGGVGLVTGLVDYLTGAAYVMSPDNVMAVMVTPGPGSTARTVAGPAVAAPTRGKYRTVAVAEFDAQGVSSTDAAVIAEMLRNRLVNKGGFTVIEKKNMEKVLSEQAFQQTGCTSAECAVKLGKLLNAQGIVVGTFGKLLGRYLVSVRLVDVETGQAVVADEAKGDTVDEIENAVDGMVVRMAAAANK